LFVETDKETLMFKNVLVGVDGTPHGRDAIALARRLMDPVGRLTLVNVHNDLLSALHAAAPGAISTEHEASRGLLEQERAAAGVEAELVSVSSVSPGAGLHQQAEKQQADLLVVGSSRHGAFGRVMLGDDARAALNGAPCAVAIASRGYAEHPAPLAKVGVGYDDSPQSRVALAAARELAAPAGASVLALQVVPIVSFASVGVVPPEVGAGIDEMLGEANARLGELPGVEGRAVYGLTGEELAQFGDQVDLLVVGSRGYGPLLRLVLGSTSTYLEGHARCPLLVLPRVGPGGAEASEASEASVEDQDRSEAPAAATT
jgi:nucleotide-binding universal stress UspA family protein